MMVNIYKQDGNVIKKDEAFTIEGNQEKVIDVLKKEEE